MSVKYSMQTSQNMVPDVCSSAHRMRSTAASQPISATSLVNHTMFVSSTVLQETHASCGQHSNSSTRKALINALSSKVSTGIFTNMASTMT